MMRVGLLFLLLAVPAASTSVTPTQKVIQMLEDMSAKSKAEKEDEASRFKDFQKFCQGAAAAKVRSIDENTAVVGKLENEIGSLSDEVDALAADIAKADADIGTLSNNIAQLDTKMKEIGSEEAAEQEERGDEHAEFEKADTDYADSIDAMNRMIHEVKNAFLQTSDPAARRNVLLQLSAKSDVPAKAKRVLTSFLQTDPNTEMMQVPQGTTASYDGQLGAVTEMFTELESKMSDERSDGQNTESDAKHNFDMMMLQLNDQMKNANADREKKAADKAAAEQAMAEASANKAETEATIAADQKYLAELKAECAAKTAAFEERQATRAGELEAIAKAVEILGGDAVSGAAAKHLPGFLQTKKRGFKGRHSLIQFRSNVASPRQRKVASFLQAKATTTHSRMLAMLSEKVAQDPFAKVVKMIQDMITKLTNEANEEAEHKGFCDQELSANQATRDEKSEAIDELNANIEELSATINKLNNEIAELNDGVNALNKAAEEATALRDTERVKNEQTVVDAKAAIEAVTQATAVLKDFYAKAAEFVQTKTSGPTDGMMEDADYKGSGGSSNVMNMLEVILSDFQRLESETSTNEQQAADDYATFMADTGGERDQKAADIKSKETTKAEKDSSLSAAKEDLKNTQAELAAATEYYDKLKPSCVDTGLSYEDRVARREAEIANLKEAYGILDGTDVAV